MKNLPAKLSALTMTRFQETIKMYDASLKICDSSFTWCDLGLNKFGISLKIEIIQFAKKEMELNICQEIQTTIQRNP